MAEEEIEVEASLVFQRNLKVRLVSGEIWKGNLVVYESSDPYVLLIRFNTEHGEQLEMDVFKDDLSGAMKHFLAGNAIRYPCVLVPNRIEEAILQFIKHSKPPKVEDLVLWILSRTECLPGKTPSHPSTLLLGGQVNNQNITKGRTRGEALLDELNQSFSHTKAIHTTHATVQDFKETTREHCLVTHKTNPFDNSADLSGQTGKKSFKLDSSYDSSGYGKEEINDLGMFDMTRKLLGKSKTLSAIKGKTDRTTSKTVNMHTVNFSDEHWELFNEIEATRATIKEKMDQRRRLLEASKIRQQQVADRNLAIRQSLKSAKEGNKFLYEAQEELKYLKRVEADIDEDMKKQKNKIRRNSSMVSQTIAPNGYANRRGKSVKGPKIGDGPLSIEAVSTLKDPEVEKAVKKYYWDSAGRKHLRDFSGDDEKSLVDIAMDAIRKAASNIASFKLDLRQIFNQFDTSGDGFLTMDEMAEAFLAMGVRLDLPTMKAIFAHFDPNGSGSVHYGEFVWAFFNRRGLVRQWKKKTEGLSEREIREKFHKFDKNGNGYLSSKEFAKLLKDLGLTLNDKEVITLIERFDVNGDDEIDYMEFKAFIESEQQDFAAATTQGVAGTLPKPRTASRTTRSRSPSPAITTTRVKHNLSSTAPADLQSYKQQQQQSPLPSPCVPSGSLNPYSDAVIPPPIPLKKDQPFTNKHKQKVIEALAEETDVLWLSRMLSAQAEIEERLGKQYYRNH